MTFVTGAERSISKEATLESAPVQEENRFLVESLRLREED